jgi:hypothetical protein
VKKCLILIFHFLVKKYFETKYLTIKYFNNNLDD